MMVAIRFRKKGVTKRREITWGFMCTMGGRRKCNTLSEEKFRSDSKKSISMGSTRMYKYIATDVCRPV